PDCSSFKEDAKDQLATCGKKLININPDDGKDSGTSFGNTTVKYEKDNSLLVYSKDSSGKIDPKTYLKVQDSVDSSGFDQMAVIGSQIGNPKALGRIDALREQASGFSGPTNCQAIEFNGDSNI